jgi:hypothetical protein
VKNRPSGSTLFDKSAIPTSSSSISSSGGSSPIVQSELSEREAVAQGLRELRALVTAGDEDGVLRLAATVNLFHWLPRKGRADTHSSPPILAAGELAACVPARLSPGL